LSIPKKGLVAKRIAFHSRVPQVKFLIWLKEILNRDL
jgi:hypothetical protein